MPTIKEVIEHLKEYPEDMHIAYMLWQPDDVKSVALGKGLLLTNDQINEVLDRVYEHADAEYGISWLTIEAWVDDLFPEQPEEDVEYSFADWENEILNGGTTLPYKEWVEHKKSTAV